MECESKEKDFMKQFGETDASEFNYEKCCDIFRQLIDQVAKENQVTIENEHSIFVRFVSRNERRHCNPRNRYTIR